MNIDQMIDRAKEYSGCKSDRALARQLGVSQTAINYYRTKRSWPSEDSIIRIAEMAHIDPAEAVIELNIWRAKGPELEVYQSILSRLRQTAAALLVALFAGLAGLSYVSDAQAKTAPTLSSPGANAVYYGKYCANCFIGNWTGLSRATAALSTFGSVGGRVVLSSPIASIAVDEGRLYGHDLSGEARFSGSCVSR